MKYKNVFFTFLLVVGLLVVASLAMAQDNTSNLSPTTTVSSSSTEDHMSSKAGDLKQHRTDMMNEIQTIKKTVDDKKTALTKLKNSVGGTTNGRIVGGTVTAISGGIFTVKNNNKIFTVNTDSNTKCVRHFFGTCKLSEIVVNDKVNVYGSFTDDAKTTLLAKEIRDASIMKVHGTFLGNVLSKTDSSFVLQSKERGNQTVTFTTTTKFTNRVEQPITFADIQVGNRLRVTGVWDKANNTISLIERAKDYSIPLKPSVHPSEPAHMPPAATSPSASSEGTEESSAPGASNVNQ